MKYIYLAIDDYFINEWYEYVDFFAENKMKVTFFLSNFDKFTAKEWDKIKKLKALGHCIGFHGLNHLRAGVCDVPLGDRALLKRKVHKMNWMQFKETEINHGLYLLKENGITAEHYSYPYGNHTPKTNDRLLKIFKSLKIGGGGKYPLNGFPRIYGSVNYGKKPTLELSGHEYILRNLKNGEVACLYMHEPVRHRLDHLLTYGYKFVTIGRLVK